MVACAEVVGEPGESDRAVLPVHNFTYGLLTPVLGYVMSCMGAFLGLRCTTRARPFGGRVRAKWLLLGGVSIGTTGVWLMHFIAMLGFTIPGETIYYNVPVTILSLLVVVGIVCVGLLIVGFGRDRYRSLLLGGLITGIGVAVMHYLGMAAMRMPGRITYNPVLLILSVVIAIVAATAALWAALGLRGIGTTLVASLIMGIAVSGMHYTGMAAMRVFPASGPSGMVMGGAGGATAESFLLPLILGITVVSFVLTATIALSPSVEEIRYDAALLDHIRRRTQPQQQRRRTDPGGRYSGSGPPSRSVRDSSGSGPPSSSVAGSWPPSTSVPDSSGSGPPSSSEYRPDAGLSVMSASCHALGPAPSNASLVAQVYHCRGAPY
jgi:NO-binding membrane sensor protein with MHYT domain